MKASVEIQNASVSYFLRKPSNVEKATQRGSVGAEVRIAGRYLEVPALRSLSLSVSEGDRVGLIGSNGSGKSTLLKLCAGAVGTQRGSVNVWGRVSPQFALGSGVKPELTGRQNAELKSLYLGVPHRSIRDRIEKVKEVSGLGGYFELPVRSYSAGMRSRLVMSLMLLVKGDILLMDEWISAADASVNKMVSKLQRDLIESSSILVLASHSRRVLEDWVDKLLWLEKGELVEFGRVSEVYERYNRFMSRN